MREPVFGLISATHFLALILIVWGYALIRQKATKAHTMCMMSAFFIYSFHFLLYIPMLTAVKNAAGTVDTLLIVRIMMFLANLAYWLAFVVFVPLIALTLWHALLGRFWQHILVSRYAMKVWLFITFVGFIKFGVLYLYG